MIRPSHFPLEEADYDEANWQRTYLVIGHGAAGDVHLLDTTLTVSPVYLLSHEDHSIKEEWSSLEAFVEDWYHEIALAQEQQAQCARIQEVEAKKMRRLAWILLVIVAMGIAALFLLIRLPHVSRTRRSALAASTAIVLLAAQRATATHLYE